MLALVLAGCGGAGEPVPPAWRDLVQTKGQHYPVPRAWLATEEARIAHDLVLPGVVPAPVPFDFEAASGPWYWPRSKREVAAAYFRHLCRTEAGEWILERPENVEGLYFARPAAGENTERYVNDIYGVEAPWVEGHLMLAGDSLASAGRLFVSPPFRNYLYVEQPRSSVAWQKSGETKYVKFSGYKTSFRVIGERFYRNVEEVEPMQMTSIDEVSASYGYTWRGVTRPRDREMGISGSELIVYRISDKKVVATLRNFIIGRLSARVGDSAHWMLATSCKQIERERGDLYVSEFVRKVLKERVQ